VRQEGLELWALSGNRVYRLEPQARKFAAENVRVTGNLWNDTIYIMSIKPITH
jgi:hypothetical protein